MIICPNLSNPEVAREFNELVQATSEQAAYHIWSLNNGNAIDRAPNGAPSKLFLTLLEYYKGDRTKAIQAKAKTYGKSFLDWFGDWTGKYKILAEKGRAELAYEMEEDALLKINPEYALLYRAIRKKSLELNHVPRHGEYSYEQLLADAGLQKYISTEYYAIDIKEDVLFSLNSNYDEARIDLVDLKRKHPELDLLFEKFQTVTSEGLELIKGFLKQDITLSIYDNLYALNDISKVVDENGEPLVVYHGNKDANLKKFEPGKGKYSDRSLYYFSDDIITAKSYATEGTSESDPNNYSIVGFNVDPDSEEAKYADFRSIEDFDSTINSKGKVYAVFLNIRNPLTDVKPAYIHGDTLIKGTNYDGMISEPFADVVNGSESKRDVAIQYVATNPNQIKSIDNQGPTPYEGTFSRENDDIFDDNKQLLLVLKNLGQELMKKCKGQ